MAKDKYYELVKQALIDDGWTITDDPLIVPSLIADLEVDLGAERIIGAEKGTEKIAVEVKSFLGKSMLHDFYKAIGQFGFYYLVLSEEEPDRILYLAIPDSAYRFLYKDPISVQLSENNGVKLIVYSIEKQSIKAWKK